VALTQVIRRTEDEILEGLLVCTRSECQQEYPILDGIPLLVPSVRTHVSHQAFALMARSDLSQPLMSLIGDCCGPESPFETLRRYLSTYTLDHWGDQDPEEGEGPGAICRVLEAAWQRGGATSHGPTLDLGCSVGRSTFELARRTDGLVLGIDLSFSMVQLAAEVMRTGQVRYPRRRVGLVYDQRTFPVECPGRERVDFWVADATALPLRDASMGTIASLNLLDCVPSPYEHLTELRRLLLNGGRALLTTPFDWSPSATPVEAWIGGHSQRAERSGGSAASLRALLTSGAHPHAIDGLTLLAEAEGIPWTLRVHDRSAYLYELYLAVLERRSSQGE